MRIGVFCSGGDAPGMNACIRAVVRAGVARGDEMVGINCGYQGLLDENFYVGADGRAVMGPRSVSNILQHGGTILRTSRCEEFRTEAGQRKAASILKKHRIDALIPIGGDGTFHGAVALEKVWNGQIVGTPGTIDNDLLGTDYTIGFHTAVQTAVEAVDKLRDTAESHERMFLIEVMGRHSGYIALHTALCGGGEIACLPETVESVGQIVEMLTALKARGKHSIIMILAEGDEMGGAETVAQRLHEAGCPFPLRAVILGHIQRGGSPVPGDRLLASRLGAAAVDGIHEGRTGVMAGEIAGKIAYTPFAETYTAHKAVPTDLVNLLATLAN